MIHFYNIFSGLRYVRLAMDITYRVPFIFVRSHVQYPRFPARNRFASSGSLDESVLQIPEP